MSIADKPPPVGAAAAVVGSTTIDCIRRARARDATRIGGVTTYSGTTYRRMGVATHIVTNIAAGDQLIGDRLRAEGLQLHLGASPDTTRFVNQVDGDRRRQQMPAAAAAIGPAALQPVLPLLDWVHLGPLHPLDLEADLLTLLTNWGRPVLLDAQGYTRRVMPGSFQIRPGISQLLPAALQAAHMVKTSQKELEIILGALNTNPHSLIAAYAIEELVVTQGARGGTIWSAGRPPVAYAAPIVRGPPGDPTGAGDVFFAAYAVGRLVQRRSTESASRRAAKIAARQVAGEFVAMFL